MRCSTYSTFWSNTTQQMSLSLSKSPPLLISLHHITYKESIIFALKYKIEKTMLHIDVFFQRLIRFSFRCRKKHLHSFLHHRDIIMDSNHAFICDAMYQSSGWIERIYDSITLNIWNTKIKILYWVVYHHTW